MIGRLRRRRAGDDRRRSAATPRPPAATPTRSGCRRCWRRRRTTAAGKDFYADHDRVVARAEQVRDLGFGWLAINATAIFQAGARTVDEMVEQLDALHTRLRAAVG